MSKVKNALIEEEEAVSRADLLRKGTNNEVVFEKEYSKYDLAEVHNDICDLDHFEDGTYNVTITHRRI